MASSLPCPVARCKGRHLHGQAMCRRHWAMVTPATQDEIHAAQRRMFADVDAPGPAEEWRQVCRTAVEAVEALDEHAIAGDGAGVPVRGAAAHRVGPCPVAPVSTSAASGDEPDQTTKEVTDEQHR